MKIAGCLITKGDEELKNLKKAVESMLPAVDTVHITANHKHVKTKRWCKEMGYDFSYLPWNKNFSEQRNFNFNRVPKDTTYILWADGDDLIVGADKIRDIATKAYAQGLDAVFFDYWYSCTFSGEPSLKNLIDIEVTQERERLLKPGAFLWHKRLHESPMPLDGTKSKHSVIVYSDEHPVAWMHCEADRFNTDMAPRMARNREILELDLQDERSNGGQADPRTLLYLMKIYGESWDKETLLKLIDMGREYLQRSGWDQERGVCYHLMTTAYGKLGDNVTAVKMAHKALEEYPTNPLSYLYLARCYYNLKNYSAMEHWMKVGLSLPVGVTAQPSNILELKMLSAELMLQFNLHGKKDIRKAYEASVLVNKFNPTPENQNAEDFLYDQKELDIASENAHKLMKYYESIGKKDLIPKLCTSLPNEMQMLPFAVSAYNKYKEPRIWGEKEICYYATFGSNHLFKWDGDSIKKGVGGSETAVIKLSEEWSKLGYHVTVYCDCGTVKKINDVLYMPYYMFNRRDFFNIFISWRHNMLTNSINSRKHLIDLHDLWVSQSFTKNINAFDKIMVKSNFHRECDTKLPDSKFAIIGNGITL